MRFIPLVLCIVYSAVGQTIPVSPAITTFSPPAQVETAPSAKAPDRQMWHFCGADRFVAEEEGSRMETGGSPT